MNTYRTVITSILFIGLASAAQTTSARELPDSIQQFAEAQQQQILIQGYEARRAIAWTLKDRFAEQRVAFIESQLHGIQEQGERALASIRNDFESYELAQWTPVTRTRVSFTQEQGQDIGTQGRKALEAIKSDVRLVGLDHPVAGKQPGRLEAANWPTVAANTR